MTLKIQSRKIVICDADRTVLELLQIRLELVGGETFVARTGPAALETISTVGPDAVILDLSLPEMDGFEVLRALDPRGEGIAFPVLVMANKPDAQDIERALSLGACDALIKPFSGAEVLERVARQFRRDARSAARSAAA